MKKRVQAGWSGGTRLSRVNSDRRMAPRVKEMALRPAMMYDLKMVAGI